MCASHWESPCRGRTRPAGLPVEGWETRKRGNGVCALRNSTASVPSVSLRSEQSCLEGLEKEWRIKHSFLLLLPSLHLCLLLFFSLLRVKILFLLCYLCLSYITFSFFLYISSDFCCCKAGISSAVQLKAWTGEQACVSTLIQLQVQTTVRCSTGTGESWFYCVFFRIEEINFLIRSLHLFLS